MNMKAIGELVKGMIQNRESPESEPAAQILDLLYFTKY